MIQKIFYSVIFLNFAFFSGLILGEVAHKKATSNTPEKTAVKNISGAPLSAIDYTDGTGVHIAADYSGAGSSEINIPLSRIPQEAAWIEKRRGVSVMVSPRGALYALGSYRFDSLYVSGGVRLPVSSPGSFRDYDFLAGAGLWW